jgi:hypothetical protein
MQGQAYGYDMPLSALGNTMLNQFSTGFDPRAIVAAASHEVLTRCGNAAYSELYSRWTAATADLTRAQTEMETIRCVSRPSYAYTS